MAAQQLTDAEIRMRAALLCGRDWAHAYSVGVFPEPDLEAARQKLGDAEMAKLHAVWGGTSWLAWVGS